MLANLCIHGDKKLPRYVTKKWEAALQRGKNHPAVLMWRGHEPALIAYGIAVCAEWIRRGREDTTMARLCGLIKGNSPYVSPDYPQGWVPPPWLGDERLHANHRARLLQKNPKWYVRFGWSEEPTDVNFWPVALDHEYDIAGRTRGGLP